MIKLMYFKPYGDDESNERQRIMNFLERGWTVACVYGGNRPTVILREPRKIQL